MLARAAAEYRDWMERAALPLWAATGGARGFLEEHGRPEGEEATTLAQARQIYVFAHAALLGWPAGLPAARAAWALLRRTAWEDGWVHAVHRAGGVLDPAIELYDQAPVLLALAWLARAGEAEAIPWAHRTLDAVEARLTLPGSPGFANRLPPDPGPRQQNPHMHLLEAMLALHAATGEARFARLGRDLVALFRDRLFDPATGTMVEYYGPDWQRLPEPWPGRQVWPGHLCEWAWLLDRAAAQFGTGLRAEARALTRFAERHATEPRTGLLRYAVTEEGVALDPSVQLWPQTEALKAALVQGRLRRAGRILRGLLDHHLARQPRGTWMEEADRPGRIPATSFYHLFLAYAELRRVLG
ncbi:AGE family epimerase/isomerase [Belnapia sp. T6]|uniref:AGE family epimerase/isomerase n=1 Tax=Belnapia mucosa TaxID=2804532 RepID=A0ABS1V489_9PROT|nr:AGE family epimerase/isomerase [Belnapia mucosa]MBL6456512.1 AGE family epimerase/isomerase [Belnapia mucosa]